MINSPQRHTRMAIWVFALLLFARFASAQTTSPTPRSRPSTTPPVTSTARDRSPRSKAATASPMNRSGFKFFMAGAQIGKVLIEPITATAPAQQLRVGGRVLPLLAVLHSQVPAPLLHQPLNGLPLQSTALYTVGGTFTGISITPVIFRWNLAGAPSILLLGTGGRWSSFGQTTNTQPTAAHPTTSKTMGPTPTPVSGTSHPRSEWRLITSSIHAAPSTSARTLSTSPAPRWETEPRRQR